MKREQVKQLVKWLNEQIEFANRLIGEAKDTKNYGKEIQYLGMRDAFLKCLEKLPESQTLTD